MAKTPTNDQPPRPERFEQPLDAIELVRTGPSDEVIQARIEAGETLDDIAASIAIAEIVNDNTKGESE